MGAPGSKRQERANGDAKEAPSDHSEGASDLVVYGWR